MWESLKRFFEERVSARAAENSGRALGSVDDAGSVTGRGMQTNSVRISLADNCTFA